MKAIFSALMAIMLMTNSLMPVTATAGSPSPEDGMAESLEGREKEEGKASTSYFSIYDSNLLDDYNKAFQMDSSNIEKISNNAGHYGNSVIAQAIDGKRDTHWETNKPNTETFHNEVEFELKEAATLNRIVYAARNDSGGKGFAKAFDIYGSEEESGDYTYIASGTYNGSMTDIIEIKFKPTTFKRLKFVYKEVHNGWASAAEFQFYTEDPVSEIVEDLFTNGSMDELKPQYASVEVLDRLEQDINDHPLKGEYQVMIDIARDVLNDNEQSNGVTITASQRGNPNATANMHQIARTSFSLDTFGRYVVPGETIQVFVDADKNGIMPNLVLGQIADHAGSWIRRYSLKPGLNKITAPDFNSMKPAVVYIENPALPEQQAYAPRVRLVGGTDFPVFYHDQTDPDDFEQELKEYVKNVSFDDNDFANGKPEDLVYNVAELVSENNTISTSATGALKGIGELKPHKKTVQDTMDEWEFMWEDFQLLSGRVKDDPDPRNRYFPAKYTSRVFADGPYAWSDWGYTGYNGGKSPQRDTGFFKDIVKPFSTPGVDGWAYYHEWGHNINNSKMEHIEITNNLFAVELRQKMEGNNNDRVNWNSLYQRFQGKKVNHGFWTYLGVLQQIQYYYGEDSYGKASRVARTNPDGIMDGLNSNLEGLVIGFSVGVGVDLTDFFNDWGYVEATDKMRGKLQHLPKPDVKLEYMHSSARGYSGEGFSDTAKVDVHSIKTNEEKGQNELRYGIDLVNKDAVMGYEILRDGKLIGYTVNNSFTDNDVDPDKSYVYEIIAYDKLLNKTEATEVHSKQPHLAIEEHMTLKMHEDYDPLTTAKALSHIGEDITERITVKSNNIDPSKKGNYKVVYSVIHEDVEVTKTSHVKVVGNYKYASDLQEVSAVTAWGGFRKDLSPAGNPITLIRQGMEANYVKGLGMHANAEAIYDITGEGFDYFESYIGIDQEAKGGASSATFEVWVDEKLAFNSDMFYENTEHEFISIPVKGASKVKLVTTDGNNGNTRDHTVWADAKFIEESGKPELIIPEDISVKVKNPIDLNEPYQAIDAEDGDLTDQVIVKGLEQVDFDKPGKYTVFYTVQDSDGHKVTRPRHISVVDMDNFGYVSDYDWISEQNNHQPPRKNLAISGNKLRLTNDSGAEVVYEKGIGTHAKSTIVYDLAEIDAAYLTSFVGVDRAMYNSVGSVVFQVFVDDKKLFDSGLMRAKDPQKYLEVDISGGKELKLVVTDGGNGIGSDHATWGDVKFHFAGEDQVSTYVDVVDSDSDFVTGLTMPGADVLVKDANGKKLGESHVDKHGNFTVKIPKQDIGSVLTIVILSKEGIQLDQVNVKVEKGVISIAELKELIQIAQKYKADDYTETSYLALQASIAKAASVIKDHKNQQEIAEMIIELQQAIDGLVKADTPDPEPNPEPSPEVNVEALGGLIVQAKGYRASDYTRDSYDALQRALTEAEKAMLSADTQEAIDHVLANLKQAIDGLVKAKNPGQASNPGLKPTLTPNPIEKGDQAEQGKSSIDERKEHPGDKSVAGERMPNTSTQIYNMFLVGFVLLGIGVIVFKVKRKSLKY